MKGRMVAVAFFLVVGLILFSKGPQAQAYTELYLAVNNVFTALNSGDVDTALAMFSEDAVAQNQVRSETYVGLAEIRQMLAGMHRVGRRLDIVKVETAGNRVIVTVVISDGGAVWGSETFFAELEGGKIKTFNLAAVRLELWRIRQ